MGLSATGPITPYAGSWAWTQEQRRKLAALRERATSLYLNNQRAEAAECDDDAAVIERSLRRGA